MNWCSFYDPCNYTENKMCKNSQEGGECICWSSYRPENNPIPTVSFYTKYKKWVPNCPLETEIVDLGLPMSRVEAGKISTR